MAKTREVDQNIIKALKAITLPILIKDNVRVIFAEEGRNQTRFEHIADKKHRLKISDIECIEKILKKPSLVIDSKKRDQSKIFYGRRKGNRKPPYLKIVIDFRNEKLGKIKTVYRVKKLGA
ncbi:MAG: hypothetical protein MJ241_06380 [Bacilli bacterium]|nr:hypothetical protein [Bacilli bacterium]